MLTLYGRGTSDNVQKVLWALGETGQPFAHVPLGGSYGGLDDPCFAAMNPHRRVPTLKDGDTVVWESDAIIRYVAAKYSYGMLWPVGVSERSRADQWMAWTLAHLYDDSNLLFWLTVRTPGRGAGCGTHRTSAQATLCPVPGARRAPVGTRVRGRWASDDGGRAVRRNALPLLQSARRTRIVPPSGAVVRAALREGALS